MDDLKIRIQQVIMLVKLLKDVIGIVASFLPEGAFDFEENKNESIFSFLFN